MTANELKIYLYNVYCLEKQKYDMKCALNQVQREIDEAAYTIEKYSSVKYQQEKEVISTGESIFGGIFSGIFMGLFCGVALGYFTGLIGILIDINSKQAYGLTGLLDKVVAYGLSVIWPLDLFLMEVSFKEWLTMWNFKLFAAAILLCIFVFTILTLVSLKGEQRQTIEENRQIVEDNKRLSRISQQTILSNQKYVSDVLIPEQKKLTSIYKKTGILLDNLYSINVIGEKYRNLVAVSSFCEYLKYERCDTLTGVNGAYNKFEDELYKRQIVSKLDEVLIKMDQIKENQYMLYNAIQEAEEQREQLYSDLKHQMSINNSNQQAISESLDRLDYNTQRIETNLEIERYWREIRR